MRSDAPFSLDWIGVDNPWTGVNVDLIAPAEHSLRYLPHTNSFSVGRQLRLTLN